MIRYSSLTRFGVPSKGSSGELGARGKAYTVGSVSDLKILLLRMLKNLGPDDPVFFAHPVRSAVKRQQRRVGREGQGIHGGFRSQGIAIGFGRGRRSARRLRSGFWHCDQRLGRGRHVAQRAQQISGSVAPGFVQRIEYFAHSRSALVPRVTTGASSGTPLLRAPSPATT